jgi:hypothetical protein
MGLEFLLAFALWVPLAMAGGHLQGSAGVFTGISVANIIGGIVAMVWIARVLNKLTVAATD